MRFTHLVEMITYVDQNYQNPKAFNFKQNGDWVSFSSQEFARNVRKLTLAMNECGLKPFESFGIVANSSPIWLMFNFASMSVGAISVPIFANISKENLLFEINDAKIEYFFCDSLENLNNLLESGVKFKKIITFGFKHNEKDKNIIDFEEFLLIGEQICNKNPDSYHKLAKKVKKDDIATIIYTSGSTGVPKGVEITHSNLIAQIKAADERFPLKHDEDVAFSFLPLAHIFEGMVMSFYVSKGITIYFCDDPKNIGDLIRETKPTLMTVVPRMLEKSFAKMKEGVEQNGLLKRSIGNLAFKLALNTNPDEKTIPGKFLFNKLVYKKLTAALGGNLKMMICGGAPLACELEQFFNNVGVNLFVGYGLTETSPVIGVNYEGNRKIGTIGKAFAGMRVKVVEGELLTKGPCVMKGYHNNKQKTDETIDKDGWLRTGDLAQIDVNGFIKITGRKKELFKTGGGKYVSPVPIEQKLLQNCSFLTAALVVAEGRKFVSALLFADIENLTWHKKKFKMEGLSDAEFFASDFIKNQIEELVEQVNKGLNEWEKIRKFVLITDELTIENGDLTPSMKLKRKSLEDKYHNIIDEFFR